MAQEDLYLVLIKTFWCITCFIRKKTVLRWKLKLFDSHQILLTGSVHKHPHTHIYTHTYIYIERERKRERKKVLIFSKVLSIGWNYCLYEKKKNQNLSTGFKAPLLWIWGNTIPLLLILRLSHSILTKWYQSNPRFVTDFLVCNIFFYQ